MEYIENLLGEEWKQFKDTPYFFSNYGRVKRRWVRKEVLLNPYLWHRNNKRSRSKMAVVKIHKKQVNVARTVWELFKGPIPEGYSVHHKDNTWSNNDINNLELLTPKELGHKTGGRTRMRRLVYCYDNGKTYLGTRAAAKALFVSPQTISDICNGVNKRDPLVKVRWLRNDE